MKTVFLDRKTRRQAFIDWKALGFLDRKTGLYWILRSDLFRNKEGV